MYGFAIPGEATRRPQAHAESIEATRPKAPLPLVLLVHGGPYGRDRWGFHGEHQLLANRGYAVLSVNYRGSEGFGKRFIEAADREWGGKVVDDVADATGSLSWARVSAVTSRYVP
jgi:dipeptidyl aminopeptidase/acylaminoacyl peptidase